MVSQKNIKDLFNDMLQVICLVKNPGTDFQTITQKSFPIQGLLHFQKLTDLAELAGLVTEI